jgi:hypothetical protein
MLLEGVLSLHHAAETRHIHLMPVMAENLVMNYMTYRMLGNGSLWTDEYLFRHRGHRERPLYITFTDFPANGERDRVTVKMYLEPTAKTKRTKARA